MTEHHLKSWPEYFEPIFEGYKNFELRRNDRDYRIGDVLVLREWEPNTKTYSERKCRRRVRFVLDGVGTVGAIEPLKGLSVGYCILGLDREDDDAA